MEIAFGNPRNKPVTYASNIWDRGYANCAGHCIVCASAMKALGVPYCVVTLRSRVKGKPKHAIMQVGFSEDTDIRPLGGAIFVFFWGETAETTDDEMGRPSTRSENSSFYVF
jgi:hypothetical protein